MTQRERVAAIGILITLVCWNLMQSVMIRSVANSVQIYEMPCATLSQQEKE